MNFPNPAYPPSPVDISTPLYVETNILYQMDDSKFPGLGEQAHQLEPTLMIDISTNIKYDMTQHGKVHAEFYDVMESLDVPGTFEEHFDYPYTGNLSGCRREAMPDQENGMNMLQTLYCDNLFGSTRTRKHSDLCEDHIHQLGNSETQIANNKLGTLYMADLFSVSNLVEQYFDDISKDYPTPCLTTISPGVKRESTFNPCTRTVNYSADRQCCQKFPKICLVEC